MLKVADVCKRYDSKELVLVKFYGHRQKSPYKVDKSCLSNWYPSVFTVNDVTYSCMEQYIMAQKAIMFMGSDVDHNKSVYAKIMVETDPGEMKKLGRAVYGFEKGIWDALIDELMLVDICAKFTQNVALMDFLMGFNAQAVFVEASPYDDIWGIKLDAKDTRSDNPYEWCDENRLGFLITEARRIL